MAKKQRKTKKTAKRTQVDVVFISILLVNFFGLYMHNIVLPWLYLLLVIPAFFLYDAIRCAPKTWSWLIIAYAPILVSLYYLDFALSWATLLIVSIAHYYVLKERN